MKMSQLLFMQAILTNESKKNLSDVDKLLLAAKYNALGLVDDVLVMMLGISANSSYAVLPIGLQEELAVRLAAGLTPP